jgi:hypothetical protein
MVEATTVAWAVTAAIGAMFVAQYAASIKEQTDDGGGVAYSTVVGGRDALTGVTSSISRYFRLTVDYVARMATVTLFAYGLIGASIVWIIVGMFTFDPLAWLYVGITVVASSQALGFLESNPAVVIGLVAALAIAMYVFREVVRGWFGARRVE